MLRNPGALPVAPIPGHAADSLRLWLRVLKAPQVTLGFLGGTSGKESTCQCRGQKTCEFNPWVGKIPWRAWQLTLVFLPGESMDRGAWRATVWGSQKVRHDLRDLTRTF